MTDIVNSRWRSEVMAGIGVRSGMVHCTPVDSETRNLSKDNQRRYGFYDCLTDNNALNGFDVHNISHSWETTK